MADQTSRDDFNRAVNNEPKPVQEQRPPIHSKQVANHGPHNAPRGHTHEGQTRETHVAAMQNDQARSDRNNGYDRKPSAPSTARQKSLAELFAKQNNQKNPSKAAQQAKDKDRERGDD